MKSLLLRVRRANSSWESGDLEEFFRAEFCRKGEPDLELSLHEIDLDESVRLLSEFYASRPDRFEKPKTRTHLDLSGLLEDSEIIQIEASSPFRFARESHREVHLPSETAARDLAARIVAEYETRCHTVEKADVKEYARDRLKKRDPEWEAVAAALPGWRTWAESK